MSRFTTLSPVADECDTNDVAELALPGSVFSAIELAVLDIAWSDSQALRIFEAPFFKRIRGLIGMNEPLPLANPKLEALRQFARLLARHDPAATEAAETLAAEGYTPEQIAVVEVAFHDLRQLRSLDHRQFRTSAPRKERS